MRLFDKKPIFWYYIAKINEMIAAPKLRLRGRGKSEHPLFIRTKVVPNGNPLSSNAKGGKVPQRLY